MITRKAASPHICLSCRLALQRRSQLTIQPQRRWQTNAIAPAATEATLQHQTPRDENSSQHDLPQSEEPLAPDGRLYKVPIRKVERTFDSAGWRNIGLPGKAPKDTLSEYPLGRLHGRGQETRRENVEKLASTSLGDPSKVIILRDSLVNLYTHKTEEMADKEAEHIDIQRQLKEERGLASEAEVNANIDGLRPKKGEEPTDRKGVNMLVQEFQEGFSQSQIDRYIRNYVGKIPRVKSEPAIVHQKGSRILRVTPWLPGISENEDEFDADPLRGYLLESHTSKQRSIIRLLRECWRLELPELETGVGQFEIKINRDDLETLLLGTKPALDQIIGETITHESEQLEVFRSRSIIRITSAQARKDWILSQIRESLAKIKRDTIDIADFFVTEPGRKGPIGSGAQMYARIVKEHFDEKTLKTLIELTGIRIRKESSNTELHLACFEHTPGRATQKFNTLRRLLLAANGHHPHVDNQVAYASSDAKDAAFTPHSKHLTASLPWRDRLFEWTRLITPIKHADSSEETTSIGKSADTSLAEVLASEEAKSEVIAASGKPPKMKLSPSQISSLKGSKYWRPEFFTKTSALFGSVLHRGNNSNELQLTRLESLEKGIQNTFLPHVPNLSRFISSKDVSILNDESKSLKRSVILNFVPDPFFHGTLPQTKKNGKIIRVGPKVFTAFPSIEVHLLMDRNKELRLRDIIAVLHDSRTDILRPNDSVDVRFQRQTACRLKPSHHDLIGKYLAASKLDLATPEGSHLEPLPSIALPMEQHLVRPPGFQVLDPKIFKTKREDTNDKKDEEKGVLPEDRYVQYLFAGLEIRSTLALEWQGWQMTYSSIEAGRARGRRSELRLLPMKDNQQVTEAVFIEKAHALAKEISADVHNSTAFTTVDSLIVRRAAGKVGGKGTQRVKSGRRGSQDTVDVVRKVEGERGRGAEDQVGMFKYFVRRVDVSGRQERDEGGNVKAAPEVGLMPWLRNEESEYEGWTGTWEEDDEEKDGKEKEMI